jgi:hypothetical protein
MTREDAKIAMKNGIKVTHNRLGYKEWVTENKYGKLINKDGFGLSKHIFWFNRMDSVFDDGWEVFDESIFN